MSRWGYEIYDCFGNFRHEDSGYETKNDAIDAAEEDIEIAESFDEDRETEFRYKLTYHEWLGNEDEDEEDDWE